MQKSSLPSSVLAHPVAIFSGIWTIVFLLYSAGWSGQLVFDIQEFLFVFVVILAFFLFGYGIIALIIRSLPSRSNWTEAAGDLHQWSDADLHGMHRRLFRLFAFWCAGTLVEVAVSAGVPVLWTYQGVDKAPADFGVPSIHGLLMSILLSCATFSFYLFKVTRQGKYLGVPAFAALWSIVIISRDYLLGTLMQILFLQLSLIKPTKRQIVLILAGSVIVTVLFGEIGNFRSGGVDLIVALGRPTDVFPRWLPASFLWAYLYLTTPLNNLLNTIDVRGQPETISILATTAQLFPTVVRRLIFPASFLEGELVDSNFTVSTAFVDPFKDMGMAGIALFSAFAGAVAAVFWLHRSRPFFLLGYAFVALTLFFSVFYNHLLYLPYLFQLVWFYVLLGGRLHVQLAK